MSEIASDENELKTIFYLLSQMGEWGEWGEQLSTVN
jgi:hypothetical protein